MVSDIDQFGRDTTKNNNPSLNEEKSKKILDSLANESKIFFDFSSLRLGLLFFVVSLPNWSISETIYFKLNVSIENNQLYVFKGCF